MLVILFASLFYVLCKCSEPYYLFYCYWSICKLSAIYLSEYFYISEEGIGIEGAVAEIY